MRMIVLALALVAAPAAAQVSYPPLAVDPAVIATKADVQAAQDATTAAMPLPANTTSPSEMIGGQTGSMIRYAREDHTHPRITRAAVVTTDSTGAWSVTWMTALSATPVVLPVPVNTTTQPVVCNVATRTAAGATGRCWLARTLPAALLTLTSLITYDVFGAPATSIQVQALAIPATQ